MDYSVISGAQARMAEQTNLKLAARQITILYIVITKFYFLSLVPLKEPLCRTRLQTLNLKISQLKSA